MSSENSEKIDQLFTALGHEIRRGVIRILAEKGPKTFTELLNELDIKDTGTLVFHLRKLGNLIKKNEKGEYELTDLGKKAYEIMSLASLKKEEIKPKEKTEEIVKPAEKKIEVVSRENLEPMIISDKISFVIDKALLDYLKSRGKKLIVTDVVNLKISDDVDPSLFEEVVEEIYDVMNITAPKHLRPVLEMRTRDILTIRYKDKVSERELFDSGILGIVSGVTKAVSEVISATLSSVFKGLRGVTISPRISKKLVYKEDLPQDISEVEIDLSGGALLTLREGSPTISIYETTGSICR
ncbi:MAG: winged helix-turn-helix domain-containing protein, partial [Sulfolobales archaeon]